MQLPPRSSPAPVCHNLFFTEVHGIRYYRSRSGPNFPAGLCFGRYGNPLPGKRRSREVFQVHWSYGLFRIFGIQVRMHVTFLFIVAYFAFVWGALREPGGLSGAVYGVVLVMLLFGLVTIHELTHSRVAQRFGIEVTSITLLPIGGMASMSEMPQDPRQELVVSVAGPLSNVVLAFMMAVGALLFLDLGDLADPGHVTSLLLGTGFRSAYVYLMVINVMLAVFNLLPAFPMDGGRVLRSFLALRVGKARATRIAVQVGQTFALLLGLLGVLGGGVIMLLVAIFIYFGAQAEGRQEEVRAVLGDLKVDQAVNTGVETARPEQTIGEIAARLFHTYQEDFPVVDAREKVVGVLTRDRLVSSLSEHGPGFPVGDTMRNEFPQITLDMPLYEAFTEMRSRGVKAVPVMEGETLLGMLSVEDITEVYSLLSSAGPDLARRVPSEPKDTGR